MLSVLVVAEHSLGVWGLLMAVPLTVFMLDYCIRFPDSTIQVGGMMHQRRLMSALNLCVLSGSSVLQEVGKKKLQIVLKSM